MNHQENPAPEVLTGRQQRPHLEGEVLSRGHSWRAGHNNHLVFPLCQTLCWVISHSSFEVGDLPLILLLRPETFQRPAHTSVVLTNINNSSYEPSSAKCFTK